MCRHRIVVVVAAAALAATGCGAPPPAPVAPTVSFTVQVTPTTSASPAPADPRVANWVDLEVGDCVAAVPAVELGEVQVTMTDCASPHQAEVYLLTPIAVNTAVTGVADQECAAGLSPYVGSAAGDFTVTYLIDSRQDRTRDNPLPSTVICLLQGVDEQPLTGSARR